MLDHPFTGKTSKTGPGIFRRTPFPHLGCVKPTGVDMAGTKKTTFYPKNPKPPQNWLVIEDPKNQPPQLKSPFHWSLQADP